MNIDNTIEIERSAQTVWNILYKDFDLAYTWMSSVKHSHEIKDSGEEGRICYFTDKGEQGTYAREVITTVDEKNMRFSFEVTPQNTPGFLPLKSNLATITVERINANRSRVSWNAKPVLKGAGFLFSPLLKFGLSKNFSNVLKELKSFAEEKAEA